MKQQMQHFRKTSYNFMLRYFVKSCFVFVSDKNCLEVRCSITVSSNIIENSFTPGSSSSYPRFQGFFSISTENYANFVNLSASFSTFCTNADTKTRSTILVSFSLYLCYLPQPFHQIQ